MKSKPMEKCRFLTLLLAFGALCALPAFGTSFTFNVDYCSNSCLGGGTGGTVTLSSPGTDIVDVLVQLSSPLVFHKANGGGSLDSFSFNIFDSSVAARQNPALTLVTGTLADGDLKIINAGGSGWTLVQPGGNTGGAGSTFGYSLNCTVAPGQCAGGPSTLEFQVELAGLTVGDLETLTGAASSTVNVDFAANVANGSCTGIIGAGNGTNQSTPITAQGTPCSTPTATPEPSTLGLVGLSLFGLGAFGVRRRDARA